MAKTKKITVKLVRSPIGRLQKQKDTCIALGLKKMNQEKTFEATPAILGMINVVSHLVEVTEEA